MTDGTSCSAGVGIDVGGTSTRLAVFDGSGRVSYESAGATPVGPDALVQHLIDTITAAVDAVDERPSSIGVGIPGGVRHGVVTNALNLGIVDPLPLVDRLTEHFAIPVTVENDVNAAALGAWSRLGATQPRPPRSMTYLSIGTGFAAGTIVDGSVIRGGRGLAGEIGHIPFPHDDTPCACGQRGCVETVVSGQALVARMSAVGLGGTAVDLWDAADCGHREAEELRGEFVDALVWSSQLALMLLDVDAIVIGGGVGTALGDRLVDRLIARLVERQDAAPLLAAIGLSQRVLTAPTGIELGALGAHLAARAAAVPHLLA